MADIRCKKCGRWLGRVHGRATGVALKCGNCKAVSAYDIAAIDDYASYIAAGGYATINTAKATAAKVSRKTANVAEAKGVTNNG